MHIKNSDDKSLLTERQWAMKGFVKNQDAKGQEFWTNHHYNMSVVYFSEQEVHKATKEELKTYWHPERQRKAQRKKEREEYRKMQEEWERQTQEQYIERLKQRNSVLEKTIHQLIAQVRLTPENQAETIILDLETTGLDYSTDEILQVSIISGTGETLYNSYIRPLYAKSWKGAERVNHITPEMVENAPNIYQVMPEINAVLSCAKKIIGYNHDNFDMPFLKTCGAVFPEDAEIIDIMHEFAPIYGEYSEYFGNYKWQTLETCADYYGYDWGNDKAHDSLSDCRAVLFCYQAMQKK